MKSNRAWSAALFSVVFVAAESLAPSPAQAVLALTPAGTAQGFSLSTFASGFPTDSDEANGDAGPLGIAFNADGTVMVTDAAGTLFLLPNDTDGQSVASLTPVQNYGHNNALGLAQIGSKTYLTMQSAGTVDLIDPHTGAVISTVVNIASATGITTNPANNHLIVSTYSANDYDVDPTVPNATFLSSQSFDGVTTDGVTLYGAGASNGHEYAVDLASKNVTDLGAIDGDPDGTRLGSGSLAGDLFINTNGGNLYELNLNTSALTLIANLGTRGDFVAFDPNNNTLLVTQSDSIIRLTPPAGGGFGGGSAVPLPAGVWQALNLLGIIGLFAAVKTFKSRLAAR